MGQELNLGLGVKFRVGSKMCSWERNSELGAKIWVGSKILGWGQNFWIGGNIRVEVGNFVLGV